MKTANVAEAVKSEHAVALLKQMYGENRSRGKCSKISAGSGWIYKRIRR